MDTHLLLVAVPIAIGVLTRLMRRPLVHTEVARILRDLLTLRMVLRDSSPRERKNLLDAHRRWKAADPEWQPRS
ncbi:hypothetical protein [Streptomyces sp. NPDC056512]|uniref:hypothetical protein n=1 Tax=Streptomyces sp. NPDC056512 TaxID=3345846 RepID=UPI0036C29A21